MSKNLSRLILLALMAPLVLGGCATTGSGGDTMAEDTMAAKPDYRDEVGENGLLTPRAIIARFIEAIGGEEAIRSHTSLSMSGKMEMAAMGMSGETTIHQRAPNEMVMNVELPGMGTMSNGVLTDVAWSENPMTGAMLLEGEMLEEARLQADFFSALNYETTYETMETVELTEYAGEPAYKVVLTFADGEEATQWFSQETGLLIGTKALQTSEMGEAEVTQTITAYGEFDGVKMPTEITMNMMGLEIKQTVDSVVWDQVTDEQMQPPASIKALME